MIGCPQGGETEVVSHSLSMYRDGPDTTIENRMAASAPSCLANNGFAEIAQIFKTQLY
jgi:hypothetical protein